MAVEVTKFLFGEIVEGEEGLLKGPFGSDLKKSLYVPKGPDTYKVYLQENILKKNNSAGDHYISKKYFDEKMSRYAVK
jgi:type I restriction enzyme S subunit